MAMGVKEQRPEKVDDLEDLRHTWKKMFQEILPKAATSKSPAKVYSNPDYHVKTIQSHTLTSLVSSPIGQST
jgi:hypothetical protein